MIALIAAAAAAASPTGAFDCAIGQVAALNYQQGQATASMIEGLPAESLKFRLLFEDDSATVDWPDSPIQFSGNQTVLETAPGAGMVLLVAPGPCLFTEANCASMLNYAQQPDGSLQVLLTPTAVSYDKDRDTRFPFMVWMSGSCTPKGRSQ